MDDVDGDLQGADMTVLLMRYLRGVWVDCRDRNEYSSTHFVRHIPFFFFFGKNIYT